LVILKILLVTNKLYRGNLDNGWLHFYLPLKEMGYEVEFFDTTSKDDNLLKKVEDQKTDFVFCCLTGDKTIAPYEPWEELKYLTEKGNRIVFNWFCDDTWRYETFSKKAANHFTHYSTPEPSYVEKYKKDGLTNVILMNWHCNLSFFEKMAKPDRIYDISFIGYLNQHRKAFIEKSNIPVNTFSGLTHDELILKHLQTKIGLNLSINYNDIEKKTQMKLRMFEVPAAGGLLLTQHHDGIEQFYEIDKEIITFKNSYEYNEKLKFLLRNENIVKKISQNGYSRFLREHESKKRLSSLINQIYGK
jgi:spore maturation protein CgeB